MRLIVFDVNNGNCALAVCNNGYSLMLDCGSNKDKLCPVESILTLKKPNGWLHHMQSFRTSPLTMLVISHPDLDHISNIETVHTDLRPSLLSRRKIAEYPSEFVENESEAFQYYKQNLCLSYTAPALETPPWGFNHKHYQIPMEELLKLDSIKNNSSRIWLLEHNGTRVLFGGDMEKRGWESLLDNNSEFYSDISKGIDVFVAPHHGHKSAFSTKLFDVMGAPKLSILSKASEDQGESDVDTRYSQISEGGPVYSIDASNFETKKTLSTRKNGTIFIDTNNEGRVYATKGIASKKSKTTLSLTSSYDYSRLTNSSLPQAPNTN
jgi:hypothetical protein